MYKRCSYTTDEWINEAIKVHGDKYDYSLVDYKKGIIKIKIICPIHGVFEQIPKNHIHRGDGCPKCSKRKKYTTKEWINDAIKVHGHKYDYSLVKYKNKKTKVKIVCTEHGPFEQEACSHLQNHACPKCAGCKISNTKDFIEKSNLIHNSKYNYSKTNYKNAHIKIIITCKKHGDFEQTPNKHLSGRGCPKCSNSLSEIMIEKELLDKNIKFETQKRFKDCKNIRTLPFDFYLPDYNLCIEYDGEQHFRENKIWGKEKFESCKKHDQIKNIYCKENNIKLFRIKYNEDINKKLKEIYDNII